MQTERVYVIIKQHLQIFKYMNILITNIYLNKIMYFDHSLILDYVNCEESTKHFVLKNNIVYYSF